MSSLPALALWQQILIGYLVTGSIVMNIPRARKKIFSALTPGEIEQQPGWKVFAFYTIVLVASLALWPLFARTWLTRTRSLLDELRADKGYQDLMEINKLMADMSSDGCDTDEIPGAHGEFGYDLSNPVPTQGITGSTRYLGRLRAPDGTRVQYTRIGSFGSQVTPKLVDGYSLSHVDGTDLGVVYVAPYNRRNSEKTPKGLSQVSG